MARPRKNGERKNAAAGQGETFGTRLARLRRQAGYNQITFAEAIGISNRMVAYYEAQTDRVPSHVLSQISKVLGLTMDELLGAAEVNRQTHNCSPRLLQRLLRVGELSPRSRRAIVDHIDALWAKEHEPDSQAKES